MKERIDFLSKANLSLNCGRNYSIPKKNILIYSKGCFTYLIKAVPIFLLIFWCNLGFSQTTVQITQPSSATLDFCAEAPISIEAVTSPVGKPLKWSSLNSIGQNNGVFADSLLSATTFTPNQVAGNRRTDRLIVTLDEGYTPAWEDSVGIKTLGDLIECTIGGIGNSGIQSTAALPRGVAGWVEAKFASENDAVQATFGLSNNNPNNNGILPSTIDYGFSFSTANGMKQAFIRENLNFPSSPIDFVAGENIFRVEQVGNRIIYKHNRQLIYTSVVTNFSFLRVEVSMAKVGDQLDIDVSFGDNTNVFPADTIDIHIFPAIELSIGANDSDLKICEDDELQLRILRLLNAGFDKWETTNGGIINQNTFVYTPPPFSGNIIVDKIIGITDVDANGICMLATDTLEIEIGKLSTITLDGTTYKEDVCEAASIELSASAGVNADSLIWESQNGSFKPTITGPGIGTVKYFPNGTLSTATRKDLVIISTDNDYVGCPATIDTIEVTVHQADSVYNAFQTANLCEGDSIELKAIRAKASLRGNDAITWTIKNSTGVFATPTTASDTNAIYVPNAISGTVSSRMDTLIVETMVDAPCSTFKDTVVITVYNLDEITNSFEDMEICEGDSVKMDAAFGGTGKFLQWSIFKGIGTFLDKDSLDAIYIPNNITNKDLTRTDTLLVTTIPASSCEPAVDTVIVTIHRTPKITLSGDKTICIDKNSIITNLAYKVSMDTIIRWDTLSNGLPGKLPSKSGDTIRYTYSTDVPIVFPALSRKDTIIATTESPNHTFTNNQTCIAATDTVIITIIDTANISILTSNNTPICELDTLKDIEAKIISGADSVIWKLIPAHASRGSFDVINALKTNYIPNEIANTSSSRIDSLMAISSSPFSACIPDTVYLEIKVENKVSYQAISDKSICDGLLINLKTTSSGSTGSSLNWTTNKSTINLSLTGINVNYDPTDLVATSDSRKDTVYFLADKISGTTCPDFIDSVIVTVNRGHTVEIFDNSGLANVPDTLTVCEGDSVFNIMYDFVKNTTGVVWSSTNGTFNPTNDTTTAYFPNIGRAKNTTFDTLYLTSTNTIAGCPNNVRDSLYVKVRKMASLSAVSDTIMCEDASVKLSAISTGFGDTVFWEVVNAQGQFTNSEGFDTITMDTDSVIYSPDAIIDPTIFNRIDTIRYFTPNPVGICKSVEDSMFVTVYNEPTVEVADANKSRDTVHICEGVGLNLDGSYGGGAIGATWSLVDSQGIISSVVDDTIAVYTPFEGITGTFRIDTLILTAKVVAGTCSQPVHDTLIVIVNKGPVIDATMDRDTICEGTSVNISGTFGSVATGFDWVFSTLGTGTIDNVDTTGNTISAVYTPQGTVSGLGRNDLLFLVSNNGNATCLTARDSIEIFVVAKPVLDLGPDISMCGKIEQELIPTTIGTNNQLTWTSNAGTFAINPNPTGIYQPDFSIPSQTRTDGIIVTAQDEFGLCPSIQDTMLVQVIELARVTIGDIAKTCEDDSLVLNPAYSGTASAFSFSVNNNLGVVTVENNQLLYVPNVNTGQVDRIDEVIINLGDVDGNSACPTQIDTINVRVVNNPRATLVGDTTICEGTQANLLIENFGLIDTFYSRLSTSLINYPSVPITMVDGVVKDTIIFGTSLVDKFCPSVSSKIVVSIIGPTTINAGDDVEICSGFDIPLDGGIGLGANVASWSVLNNAGTFDDANKLDAIYAPNPLIDTEIRTDTIVLTSSANLSCLMGSDTLLVTTKSTPAAVLGSNVSINDGQTLAIDVNINNKVQTGIWSSNKGTFAGSTIDATTYVPTALVDTFLRIDTVIYEGISAEPTCVNVRDTLVVTILPNTRINITTDSAFCTALCLDELAANLVANQASVTVPANNIDPFDTCQINAAFDFRFWSSNLGTAEPVFVRDFPSLPDSFQFDCDSRGLQSLNVYVASDSLNIQKCPVTIDVFDTFLSCGERTVSGRITTFKGDPLEGFDVFVENVGLVGGVVPPPVKTDADGRYEFTLNTNTTYRIVPRNDEDLVAGVTAFDNVVITRHILGIQPFSSPFQTIAADVNKSGTVTAYDIVLIRKVVLARDTEFLNNTSWRFVDADFEFTDIASAASAPFMESFMVTQNMGNVLDMDFIAVKIGDANGTVNPDILGGNFAAPATDRNNLNNINFNIENIRIEKGKTYEIPFYLEDNESVQAYQFTLQFRDLELMKIKEGIATKEHFGLAFKEKGMLTAAWSTGEPKPTNKEWFSIQFKAKSDGMLKEMMEINSSLTPVEAITADLAEVGINLVFQGVDNSNFELYQNRPNPFRNNTTIGFNLPEEAIAVIKILDVQGRLVKTIEGAYDKGYNEVSVDLKDNTNGVYYYRLETSFGTKVQKLMHLE